jgi:hypothetical protein
MGMPYQVALVVQEPVETAPATAAPRAAQVTTDAVSPAANGNGQATFHPRFTFETFVVGSSNEFAHAACMAVARHPARTYNPLFIYGDVGLGKTHLLHAIGNYIQQHQPHMTSCYVSSEKFLNDLVGALSHDKMDEFRNRYRKNDLILVDDVQFLIGKERTQEEFFHTFNVVECRWDCPKVAEPLDSRRSSRRASREPRVNSPLGRSSKIRTRGEVRSKAREIRTRRPRASRWHNLAVKRRAINRDRRATNRNRWR